MKSLMIIFLIKFFFVFSIYVNSQWTRQSNGLPDYWGIGWAIDASDSMNVLISTSAGLFNSTDGGDSWAGVFLPDSISETGIDVSILDESNFWIATELGKIIATSDAGKNWSIQFYDESQTQFMNYIEMFDDLQGVAMGDALFPPQNKPAVFLMTNDGGNTWIPSSDTTFKNSFSGDTWRRIDFSDPLHGYFYESGIDPERLFNTNDGCISWNETNYDGYCTVLKCFSENIILLQSISCNPQCVGIIHKSTDAGNTWTSTQLGDGWGNDFEFIPESPSKIFFTDHNNLFFSSDTGTVWSEVFVDTADLQLRDIIFTDPNNGWILGDHGNLFKTSNGGVLTGISELANTPVNFSLSQNYPNPFNPRTTIEYEVLEKSFVTIKIYDILGREIQTLVNEEKPDGMHNVQFTINNLPSGVYFYRLNAGSFIETKKMVVVK